MDKDNKNIWIVIIVVVVTVFLFTSLSSTTGKVSAQQLSRQQETQVNPIVRAHSCNADGSCEMRGGSVQNDFTVTGDVVFNGELKPGGDICDNEQFIAKNGTWKCRDLGSVIKEGCSWSVSSFSGLYKYSACPIGKTVISGGVKCNPGAVSGSFPGYRTMGWHAYCTETGSHDAYIVCCPGD